MKQKIAAVLLGLGSLMVNASTFAMSQQVFQSGPSADWELPVNEPLVISNMFLWTVNAQCTIISKEENNYISFKVLRKSGSINSISLSTGDSLSLTLHPREVIRITAASGGKVELLNTGSATVVARCSTT